MYMHILNIIDKTSPIPLYVQVSDWLQNMIKEERDKVGAKLPSQGEPAEKLMINENDDMVQIDRFNADLNHSIQTIRAVTPPGKIAQVLGISTTVPCILLESLAYTSRDVCIEVLQSFYRGDRYLFKVETDQYGRYMRSVGVE